MIGNESFLNFIFSKLLHIITGPKQVMKDERISNEVIKLALLLKINLPQDKMSKTILKTTGRLKSDL